MHDHLAVGTRVRLTRAVDRFPFFVAPEGATGGVVENSPHLLRVRMDQQIEGAQDWRNEVHWMDGDDPSEDLERLDDDDFVTEEKREDDETPRCIQHGPDCRGKVEYHLNPDRDDFMTFARCEHHQAKRLELAEETRRKYPTLPPSDFDPAYAGERWDEDE